MTHTIPVPNRLQRPACSCGWSPALPWPVSWARFDADVADHLARFITCPNHGTQTRDYEGRCPLCRWQGLARNHPGEGRA